MSVILGIRPEHLYFNRVNLEDCEISVRSELNEYIGHEQIITYNFYDQQLLGKFSSWLFKLIITGKSKKMGGVTDLFDL